MSRPRAGSHSLKRGDPEQSSSWPPRASPAKAQLRGSVCVCVCRGEVAHRPERSSSHSEDTQLSWTPYRAAEPVPRSRGPTPSRGGWVSVSSVQARGGRATPRASRRPRPACGPLSALPPPSLSKCRMATPRVQLASLPRARAPLPAPGQLPLCTARPLPAPPESLCVFLPLVRWGHFSQGLL